MAALRTARLAIYRALSPTAIIEGLCIESKNVAVRHPQTLARGAFSGPLQIPTLRSFHVTTFAAASLQVKVPALGESITDGSIATIFKQPGDSIEEDEPILQIETDKVTIDVRSPAAGTLEAMLVKEEDNVSVGHVIATIMEGAAAGKAEGRAPPMDPPRDEAVAPPPPPQSPPSPQESPSPEQPQAEGRHAHISFPPRRTPEGEIISMMPAEQQAQFLAKSSTTSASTSVNVNGNGGIYPPPPPPQRMGALTTPEFVPRPRVRHTGPPPPPRKEISEEEMEMIMLGGADL